MNDTSLPVVVIGGGPVGLAAAAHLLARGLQPLVLEAGPEIGHAVHAWGHVRMFSPWRYNIDAAARALLEREGWSAPDGKAYPTGVELIDQYLAPLAATKALGRHVRTNARVVGIARRDHSRLQHGVTRESAPFVLHVETETGIDVARKRLRRRDDRLERCPDEIVAMRLAAGQRTGIAAKEREMRLQFVTERHSFDSSRFPRAYWYQVRPNASPADG